MTPVWSAHFALQPLGVFLSHGLHDTDSSSVTFSQLSRKKKKKKLNANIPSKSESSLKLNGDWCYTSVRRSAILDSEADDGNRTSSHKLHRQEIFSVVLRQPLAVTAQQSHSHSFVARREGLDWGPPTAALEIFAVLSLCRWRPCLSSHPRRKPHVLSRVL